MYKVPPFKAKFALFIPNEMFYTEPLDHFFFDVSSKGCRQTRHTTGYSCTSVGDVMELNYKTVCCTEIRYTRIDRMGIYTIEGAGWSRKQLTAFCKAGEQKHKSSPFPPELRRHSAQCKSLSRYPLLNSNNHFMKAAVYHFYTL